MNILFPGSIQISAFSSFYRVLISSSLNVHPSLSCVFDDESNSMQSRFFLIPKIKKNKEKQKNLMMHQNEKKRKGAIEVRSCRFLQEPKIGPQRTKSVCVENGYSGDVANLDGRTV